MLSLFTLLAVVNPLDNNALPQAQPTNFFGVGLREMLLIVGVALVLGLILFLWAYFTYKDRRHHSVHHVSRAIYRADKKSANADPKRVRIRKKRRDHPDNLPRNPTLGETGGLPPIRPDDPPPEAVLPP